MTESPRDLVSRLLAAIQEREDRANAETHHDPDEGGYYACPATRSEPYGDLPYGEENCDCGLARRRDEALRLCQAHREIVLAYEGAELQQRKRPDDEVNNGYVLGISRAVAELAEGYGIEATP